MEGLFIEYLFVVAVFLRDPACFLLIIVGRVDCDASDEVPVLIDQLQFVFLS